MMRMIHFASAFYEKSCHIISWQCSLPKFGHTRYLFGINDDPSLDCSDRSEINLIRQTYSFKFLDIMHDVLKSTVASAVRTISRLKMNLIYIVTNC